jgi:CRISPR-associated protein Csd1
MLNHLAEHARRAGLAPEPGFASRNLHWGLELAPDGRPLGLVRLTAKKGRKEVPRTIESAPEMPSFLLRTGERCHFLVESASVVLNQPQGEKEKEKIGRKHLYFVQLLREASSHSVDLMPAAAFFSKPEFLAQAREMASSERVRPTDNVSFLVGGKLLAELPSWRPWWTQYLRSLMGVGGASPLAVDILTGQLCVPLRTHDPVRGLAGVGGRPTALLISFDKTAFSSYGFEQGENAALSDQSARAYVDALNHLIREQSVPLGDVLVLHWYDNRVEREDDPFAMFSDPPEAEELDALQRCRQLLEAIRSGQKADLGRYRYFAMAVSGSGARVMVRFWAEGTLSELALKAERWLEATSIVRPDGLIQGGFALRKMAKATVPEQMEGDSAMLALRRASLSMLLAALRETPLPAAVAAAALDRTRAEAASLGTGDSELERSHRPERMALLRAFVNGVLAQKGDSMTMVKPDIDPASPHVAYHCGRLMAALAEIQRRALGDVGAGVVQRYYAAASATPALVFGRLLRGAQYHLDKLEPGLAYFFEDILGQIVSAIGDSMPPTLDLEGQTLFALGYYHQLTAMRTHARESAARRAAAKNSQTESDGEKTNA